MRYSNQYSTTFKIAMVEEFKRSSLSRKRFYVKKPGSADFFELTGKINFRMNRIKNH